MPTSQALLSCEHRREDESSLPADDPSKIRLLRLPEVGPPFDDDPAAKAAAIAGTAGAAGTAGTGGPRQGAAATDTAATETAATVPGHDATGGSDGEWVRQFARLLTEALSGARPVRQILPWTSRRARVQLLALIPLFSGGQRPRVLRVIATRPARDVIEMTVVAAVGARTRALAVRLQRADPTRLGETAATRSATVPRWLCTAIEAA